ncbi:sulfonate transport system substrate-binding protein [Limnobacter thiooxidans]|uniref:aliphatic sulfonate ABC transporter substrate-binding protein n=1 Tax=Limnobacter TaxID=131079 RepID=UPI00102D9FE3|nr:aliphatic sulfonate ABC transporter substrate-binding protein [Limnobacter sp.]MCZ8014778.1 aliphatic sulfonate ABC transporter substrate-binding protein [Limnobacter sp.]RZS40590.1 sulfonate transport system substrate-binding protein [Limnobacter thiooxidans]
MNRLLNKAVNFTKVVTAAALVSLSGGAIAADFPKELRVDFAYYSPSSLVLKKFGWLEQDLKSENVDVRWVLSQGSNRALEQLNSGSVDFGSTAGLAATLSRANGNPIKNVYILSRPEWTFLVVPKDSPIKTVADLKGKKVAATKGTDPYLFLLRALNDAGLDKNSIEHVALQHADGRTALEQRRVDAWAGLDPLLATSELEFGVRPVYRNVAYNTYSFLNTTDAFAAKYPAAVKKVIANYERARKWILANPEETAKIIAEEAKISPAVAKVQLSRNDFSNPLPGAEHVKALKAAAPILLEEDLVKKGTDVNKAIDALVDPSFAASIIK